MLQQAWWLCWGAKERKHATPQQQRRRSQTTKTWCKRRQQQQVERKRERKSSESSASRHSKPWPCKRKTQHLTSQGWISSWKRSVSQESYPPVKFTRYLNHHKIYGSSKVNSGLFTLLKFAAAVSCVPKQPFHPLAICSQNSYIENKNVLKIMCVKDFQ